MFSWGIKSFLSLSCFRTSEFPTFISFSTLPGIQFNINRQMHIETIETIKCPMSRDNLNDVTSTPFYINVQYIFGVLIIILDVANFTLYNHSITSKGVKEWFWPHHNNSCYCWVVTIARERCMYEDGLSIFSLFIKSFRYHTSVQNFDVRVSSVKNCTKDFVELKIFCVQTSSLLAIVNYQNYCEYFAILYKIRLSAPTPITRDRTWRTCNDKILQCS